MALEELLIQELHYIRFSVIRFSFFVMWGMFLFFVCLNMFVYSRYVCILYFCYVAVVALFYISCIFLCILYCCIFVLLVFCIIIVVFDCLNWTYFVLFLCISVYFACFFCSNMQENVLHTWIYKGVPFINSEVLSSILRCEMSRCFCRFLRDYAFSGDDRRRVGK